MPMKESRVREPLLCIDRAISQEQLPELTQKFIERYFEKAKILQITMEKELLKRSYEVLLIDGSKLRFSGKGDWKHVTCKKLMFPKEIVPLDIQQYLDVNCRGCYVTAIEKDRRSCEVKLDNGMELKFDLNGHFFKVID